MLFAAAVAVRALPWRTVLEGERVLPFGNDSFYHLRRVAYALAHFPRLPSFDPYLHFPDGAVPIWTPAFDWSLALALWLFVPADDALALERLAVWAPPLLGGATVAAAFVIARRHFGARAAWLGAGALCVLSGHFWYSQLGYVDHHAAVALVSTLLLGAGLAFVRSPGPLRAVALGLALGVGVLVWPGGIVHAFLVQSFGFAALLARRDASDAARLAGQLAGAHAIAWALVQPLAAVSEVPQFGRASPVVLGEFQPLWFLALACFAAACGLAWRRPEAGATPGRRLVTASLLAGAVAALVLLGVPGLLQGGLDAWRWLGREEAFQASVAESAPLLWQGGRFDPRVAFTRLSYFAALFPLAWLAAARAARRPDAAALRLLLWWSLGLCVATLLQRRFFNSFSVALALLLGWALDAGWRALPLAWRGSRARRVLAGAALAAVWLALLAPSLRSYAPHLRNALGAGKLEVSPRRAATRVLYETAQWLRLTTPPTSGWLDPAARPEYGVLTPWDAGHVLRYGARRPSVVDNFGDDLGPRNFALAGRYYRSAEPEALEIARELGARYVVASAAGGFPGPRPGPDSMLRALYLRDGSAAQVEGGPAALERHRLVYESRPAPPGGAARPSLYKVYEVVEGALLSGRAAPGAPLALELALRTSRGRELVYRARTRADDDGRYAFRVPYANRGAAGAVQPGDAYLVRCGDEEGEVVVAERSVARGEQVAAPDLCLAPEPRASGASAID